MATTNTISGNISFAGLGSGTDFTTIIDGLMKIESIRKTKLQNDKTTWTNKNTAFTDLNSKLLTLKTSLEGMNSLGKFMVKTSTASDTNVLTATAGTEATEGINSITVNQLAKNDSFVSSTFAVANSSTVVANNASTLKFDYAGSTGQKYSINIAAGATLDNIAATINKDPSNPGVRAAVVKLADNDYRLRIYGLDTGASKQVENLQLQDNSTLTDLTSFSETQNAQNAQFRVDSFPATGWIERSTNSVSDAIPGVNLLLKNTGTTTVSTATDTSAIKQKVSDFVNQVNVVRTQVQALTKIDSTTKEASLLTGNSGVLMIDQRLKDITARTGAGFDYLADAFTSLSQVGITTDATQGSQTEGLLVIDDEALDKALAKDPNAVAALFSASNMGATNSTDFSFSSTLSTSTQAGSYAVNYTVSGGSVTGTIGGYAAKWNSDTKELTGIAGTPVAGLAIRVNNMADNTYSGNVRIKNGKANELVNELKKLTDANSGTLSILKKNSNQTMNDLDKKINSEEVRLASLQQTLKARFARLDALLTQYNSINSSLSSQITSMTKSSS